MSRKNKEEKRTHWESMHEAKPSPKTVPLITKGKQKDKTNPPPPQKKHGAKRFRKKGFGLLLWLFLITQKEESGRILPGI
jgi:hypothetical protein